jgi:hypothetical protein
MLPKVGLSTFGEMAKSPEVVAVVSAAIVAPIVAKPINNLLEKIPFIGKFKTAGLLIVAVVIFAIASKVKGHMVRAVLIGVAGAQLLIAVTPFISRFVGVGA